MNKKGIIISNIGSPASPSESDVAKYLREFLTDKHIITLPYPIRWLLVNLIIVPRRAKFSAANYKRIWSLEGSPLVVTTQLFAKLIEERTKIRTKVGYRYGTSMIESLKEFQKEGINEILLSAMYPQYAYATTESSIFKLKQDMKALNYKAEVKILPEFYNKDFFIDNFARKIKDKLKDNTKLVLSFHGVPVNSPKRELYVSHCLATGELIAKKSGAKDYITTFQSRLGKTEWVKPYTTDVMQELGRNKANVLIASPAFVADCIETLEELEIGEAEVFHSNGGKDFEFIPCPNTDEDWVNGFANYILSEFA